MTLGVIPNHTVEEVIREFAETMAGGAGVIGSADEAKRLLSGLMPQERINDLMDDVRGPRNARSTWEGFNALSEQVIADYLRGEHPQTVAAILSRIKPDVAARTLPLFGNEMMDDIMLRIMKLNALPRHVIETIEETVQHDFLPAASRKGGMDHQQRIADIFNKMETNTFEMLSERLSEKAPETFGEIKSKMFTFDDLARLDTQSMSRLIRNCEINALNLALRGVKKPVRDAFMGALTQRARENIQTEVEAAPQVRLRDVRKAQSDIIDMAMNLARQDQIRLPSDDDELVA